MFEADRLTSTVAPASAANEDGGIGTQTSSQISTWSVSSGRLLALEQQVGAERHVWRRAGRTSRASAVSAGVELARLVELAVVRQVGLGHHAEQRPAQTTAAQLKSRWSTAQRQADEATTAELARSPRRPSPARPRSRRAARAGGTGRRRCRPTGRARGTRRRRRPGAPPASQHRDRSRGVEGRVGDAHARHGDRDAREAVGERVQECG